MYVVDLLLHFLSLHLQGERGRGGQGKSQGRGSQQVRDEAECKKRPEIFTEVD